jgi:O-antigen/teichoic acid export membrane protein
MRDRLLSLGRQTLVYGVSAAALQIVGVITLPVFARTFSPDEYGVLEIATVGLSAMLVIADLGMASASQRSYFDYTEEDVDGRRAVLSTALATALAAAAVIAALLIVFRGPIAGGLFDDRSYSDLVVLVALAVPMSIAATFFREVMRLRFMAWRFTISATAGAVIAAAVGVGLVLGTEVGVDGVLIGLLAGNAVAVAFGLAVTFRYIGARLSRKELRVMLAFGLPLIPAVAAMWGLAFLDRVMLSALADLEEVGQYAVGARFASVLMFVVTAFGLAYTPFMLSMFSEDSELEKQVRSRTLTYVAIVLTAVSLALALFAREIATVVAPDYTQAYEVVGVLCLGVTVFGLSSVTMAGISLARRTAYFGAYSGLALAVNLALNLVLIPPLGGFGAALATAVAYVVLTTLSYRKAQALYPTPYEPRKTVIVLLVGGALMALGFLPLGIGAVALKLLALAAFAGALVVGGVLDRPELIELRRLVAFPRGSAP